MVSLIKHTLISFLGTASLVCAGPISAQAASFTETSDAGELTSTAVAISPSLAPLSSISGSLGAADFADLFLIYVSNPTLFSATTTGNATAFDTQLFLFSASGKGVYGNDDDPSGNGVATSRLVPGNSLSPTTAGFYYLGISGFGYNPISSGGSIFPTNQPADAILGPTGPGGAFALSGWTGSPADFGTYAITLTGVGVPEPSEMIGLLSLGGLGLGAALRRKKVRA